jgi:hypothetical protein
MSDTSAATLGDTIYVIGIRPLPRAVGARPAGTTRPRRRDASASASPRGGGRDRRSHSRRWRHRRTTARRDVLSIDPATGGAGVAHLPPLAHAAGAALDGRFLVIGGRGDASIPSSAIWAIDPSAPRPHASGRLPVPLRPVRGLLGDLCSWSEDETQEAACTTMCSS